MTAPRLTILDGLRGLAAMSVVLCHYQYFFILEAGATPAIDWRALQPGMPFLELFYYHGFRAVELFWVISGFVFTAVYCFGRDTTTREFAVNRFARLYPLHLVTLLVVAMLQLVVFATFGRYLIYTNNDLYHFGLNFLMIPAWGLQQGTSYNDVIWSVSVEIAIYALFWILRDRLLLWRSAGALLVAAACAMVVLLGPPNFIFACGYFFFIGSALAFASTDLRKRRFGNAALIAVCAILGGIGLASDGSILSPMIGLAGSAAALVLLAVEAERVAGDRLRRVAQWLGDCSYGIYLWHFPLLLALLLITSRFTSTAVLATQAWFMLGYIGLLLALARVSYVVIERPARAGLRGLAKPRQSPEIQRQPQY